MRAIRVAEKSESSDALKYTLDDLPPPKIGDGECLVEVHASGVNPSDVKALLGKMPSLVWPRTPGRDYAGVVVEGPSALIGKEVWGTGGDLGMKRDGCHGEFVVASAEGVREKPKNVAMEGAGSLGVSWTCAWLGMVKGSRVAAGETVAVFGAHGKVGEASVQLASAAGASVITVERSRDTYDGHATGPVDVVNVSKEPDIRQALMDRTDGRGVDIVMNSVGDPYFDVANNSLAKEGRQIIISTFVEENMINLRTFYRGNHMLVGVSNMDHDHIVSGEILEDVRAGFEAGDYRPYPIKEDHVFGLDDVETGYKMVLMDQTRDRVVIKPQS
jgi:NADPH2:quinone reductase